MGHLEPNGTPGETYEVNVTDSVYTIPNSKLSLNDMQAYAAKVLVETNGGRYAYGVDPVAGGIGYPVAADEYIDLKGYTEIINWAITNDTGGSGVDLTITIFYR